MNKNKMVKKVALLGIGIALYVALGFMVKIPLIAHIQTDLGYIVFAVMLYVCGWQALIVGVAGCLVESLIFSGWIPIGWMIGQALIGIICGICYKKIKYIWLNIIITILAVFIGVTLCKTCVECFLYEIPFAVKFVKNFIAFIADVIPMITGYFVAKRLYPYYEKAETEHLDAENNYNSSKIYDKMQDSATKVDLISRKAVEVCNSCKNYGKFCAKCNLTDDSVYEYYEREEEE